MTSTAPVAAKTGQGTCTPAVRQRSAHSRVANEPHGVTSGPRLTPTSTDEQVAAGHGALQGEVGRQVVHRVGRPDRDRRGGRGFVAVRRGAQGGVEEQRADHLHGQEQPHHQHHQALGHQEGGSSAGRRIAGATTARAAEPVAAHHGAILASRAGTRRRQGR